MRWPSALLAALLAAAAGCGGADADAEIERVLERGLTSERVEDVCERALTPDLLERIYGDRDRCHAIERRSIRAGDQSRAVDVSDIDVDGRRATAVVALRGGGQDGAKGRIGLAERDGDWRVDELSPGFLRAQFSAGLRADRAFDARTKACLRDRVLALEDGELRDLAYGSIGERPAAREQLVSLVGICQGGDLVRREFEQGIAAALERRGATPAELACVRRALRRSLTDEELQRATAAAAGGEAGAPPAITRAVEAALRRCGAPDGAAG